MKICKNTGKTYTTMTGQDNNWYPRNGGHRKTHERKVGEAKPDETLTGRADKLTPETGEETTGERRLCPGPGPGLPWFTNDTGTGPGFETDFPLKNWDTCPNVFFLFETGKENTE
jgi:hypothetical protein